MAQDADLIIAIFDSSKNLDEDDLQILNLIKNKKNIIILNKIDLKTKINEENEEIKKVSNNIIKISALNKIGIEELGNKISELFNLGQINFDNEMVITNVRHKNLISDAIKNLGQARIAIDEKMPLDIVTISIKNIISCMNEITGDNTSEDIINEIFSKFCLGK